MKRLFRGYYSPSKDEFEWLWKNAIVVPDANVLLNLYRYTADTSDQLIEIFTKIKDRLWLPHQIALEFHKNRFKVIGDQVEAYTAITAALEDCSSKLERDLNQYRKHQYICVPDTLKRIQDVISVVKKEISAQCEKHPDRFKNDNVLYQITELFDGRVGPPYTEVEPDKILAQGKDRFSKKIPPGFLDEKDKAGDEKYGDFLAWQQLIDYVKDTKYSVIFVTEDTKDDWWHKIRGRTLGPRPELIEEIINSGAKNFHMYRTDQFIEHAKGVLGLSQKISQGAIDEVRALRVKDTVNRRFSERLIEEQLVAAKRIRVLQSRLKELEASLQRVRKEEASLLEKEMYINERDSELENRGLEDPTYVRERLELGSRREELTSKAKEISTHIQLLAHELSGLTQKISRIADRVPQKGRGELADPLIHYLFGGKEGSP